MFKYLLKVPDSDRSYKKLTMPAENLLKQPPDDHYVDKGSLGASLYRDFQVILPLSTAKNNAVSITRGPFGFDVDVF